MPDSVCEEALVESRRARALERRGIVASLLGCKHGDAAWKVAGRWIQQGEMLLTIPPPSMHEGGILKICVQVHRGSFEIGRAHV